MLKKTHNVKKGSKQNQNDYFQLFSICPELTFFLFLNSNFPLLVTIIDKCCRKEVFFFPLSFDSYLQQII